MTSKTVISVNPASNPAATVKAPAILRRVGEPARIMQRALNIVFGVGCSARHSRRLWTFRVIIGSIIMCFGLLFSHHSLQESGAAMLPGLPYAMIAGGCMIACGLLTRAASVAIGAVLAIASIHSGITTMEGYATAICAAMCVMTLLSGSGRYSLDTILYNKLTPIRKGSDSRQGCSSLRRMLRHNK